MTFTSGNWTKLENSSTFHLSCVECIFLVSINTQMLSTYTELFIIDMQQELKLINLHSPLRGKQALSL